MGRLLARDHRVFEFGTGGSTLYFASKVAEVVSVEHDPSWYERVRTALSAEGADNTHCHLVMPDNNGLDEADTGQLSYGSTDRRYVGQNFQRYASFIDRFPDEFFDLVLIDGRARVGCFGHAHPKVRTGGRIVLDNSERPQYRSVADAASDAGWICRDYFGPGPYVREFWQTSIWTKTGPIVDGPHANSQQ